MRNALLFWVVENYDLKLVDFKHFVGINLCDSILFDPFKRKFRVFDRSQNPRIVVPKRFLLIWYIAFPNISTSDYKLQIDFELSLIVRIFQEYFSLPPRLSSL